jgi:hypothetical protein
LPVNLTERTLADLSRSGLTQQTIEAAAIRDDSDPGVGQLLRDKFHVLGYVLPYHGLDCKPLSFYRVKVLESLNGEKPPKYLQPKATGNHLYVPKLLGSLEPRWCSDPSVTLFLTEGEKKALAGVQAGMPTVAVGGVFSWRTHIHSIKRGVVRVEDKPSARVVHLDDRGEKAYRAAVAPELEAITWEGREVVLIFDSDATLNDEVQRAAFELANWLDDHGARTIQISLANRLPDSGSKLGLDDLLTLDPSYGASLLDPEWRAREGFRPLPSDPHAWVRDQLNAARINRATQERVSSLAISWLDANGTRFMGVDGTYYYFDNATRVLHDFRPGNNLASLRETSFGHLIVEQLGLDPADSGTIGRMIGLFPLGTSTISPHRVIAQTPEHPDVLYYQVSDADVMRISADGLELISNGDDDVLFHRGTVEPLDLDALAVACDGWQRPKQPLWYKALSTLSLDPMGDLSLVETKQLLTCLYYMSPWLNRWRGLMLPLEIAVGEANSGKTFAFNLRKGILTGQASLAGLPDDFRSWVAAVGSAPAMWICDNLGNVRSDYWHRLNDELARLITDPAPSIELRQLYTTATTFRVPVRTTFAITTIRNPFTAPDVLQRSLLYTLSAIPVGKRDPDWYSDRMANRVEWVAEHLNVLHLFLKCVKDHWQPNFRSGFRLVHFEQALLLLGEALGWDLTKVVSGLAGVVSATVAAYDPMIEALVTFIEEWERPRRKISPEEICDWAKDDPGERFTALRHIGNAVTFLRYVNSHKYDIEQSTGIQVIKEDNATMLLLPGRTRS